MKYLLSIFILFSFPAYTDCEDTCTPSMQELQPGWRGRMRLKALKNLDQFLNWSVSEKLKTYAIVEPPVMEKVELEVPELQTFANDFSYFSPVRPLIGKVSRDAKDLQLVCCLLKTLYEKSPDESYLEFAAAEVIAKVLAYRDLKKESTIYLPIVWEQEIRWEPFTVDYVFNLWHGMPAFGLIPQSSEIPALLLYRGTDFSLDSQRGWASLMSDLDVAGPGLNAFQNAQKEIHQWLLKVHSQNKTAKVLGYSLGGVLAGYTFIYENALLSKRGSYGFNLPGVSPAIIEKWDTLSEENKKGFTSFVNEGDLVSKVGKLFGTVYVLSIDNPLKPLTAHTILMSGQSYFFKEQVDVAEENSERH